MARKKRQRRVPKRSRPFYPLSEVRELVKSGRVLVHSKALDGARDAFGWGIADILDAITKLEPRHFYKMDVARFDPRVVLDFYKATGLKGENIYTHFYIDDEEDKLIVNSFKEI